MLDPRMGIPIGRRFEPGHGLMGRNQIGKETQDKGDERRVIYFTFEERSMGTKTRIKRFEWTE